MKFRKINVAILFSLLTSFFLLSTFFYGGNMSEVNLPEKHGIYQKSLVLEGGDTVRYTLSIPKSFSPGEKVPLIIALHYGGDVIPWYGKGYLTILVEPALWKLGAVIAAPDCPSPAGWDNPRSEAAVLALMNHLKQHYTIDDKKVVLTGFSLGGIGTWYLAARYPDLFSAAIPMSAMPRPDVAEAVRDIPVYVIHSTGDEIFPVKRLEEVVEKLKIRGLPVQMKTITGISHYQTPSFVDALRETIPWIKQTWKKKD